MDKTYRNEPYSSASLATLKLAHGVIRDFKASFSSGNSESFLSPMPKKSESPILIEQLDEIIYTIRGARVMLDRDLAKIYGVPTFRFNEAIKRNRHRFPPDLMFQVTRKEFHSLKSQIAMSKAGRGGRRTLPYAFTEHGALQAANVLRSPRAVQMSVFVIRAFIKMREALRGTPELARKLTALEKKLTARLDAHEAAIVEVLKEVMQILNPTPLPHLDAELVFTSLKSHT